MKRPRVPTWLVHIGRVAARALLAAAILVVALAMPLPGFTPHLFVEVYVPLLVAGFVIYIGKLLYDTFFYDRYKP